jgi:hypothetical protein
MADLATNKFLLGYHMSGVTIRVRYYIGGMRLVGAGVRLRTSTSEVSSFTTIITPLISRVLYWPLDGLLSLHILASWCSSLSDVGLLYEQTLWTRVALHGSLGSLLELSPRLLLRRMLDRCGRWHTYPRPGVVSTLSLALLLPLAIHDTTTVL